MVAKFYYGGFSFYPRSRKFNVLQQGLDRNKFSVRERKVKEVELLKGPPFSFYRIMLQYCFNSEYNKLPESKQNPKFPDSHISFVYLLNEFARINKGSFEPAYRSNMLELDSIISSM